LDRPDKFDFTIPATIPEAKQHFHEEFRLCLELLGSLGQQADATIVVPDTNVLVRSPDIGRYHQVLGTASYTVVLVAPVLAELDALKTGRASPSVRDRARGFSNRIKEWRRRGQLHVGVKVEGQVVVRAEGREPNMQATLSWLDPTVVDDRIIACTLELQRRRPTDLVVLLTGDVNLLAKADMAGIPNRRHSRSGPRRATAVNAGFTAVDSLSATDRHRDHTSKRGRSTPTRAGSSAVRCPHLLRQRQRGSTCGSRSWTTAPNPDPPGTDWAGWWGSAPSWSTRRRSTAGPKSSGGCAGGSGCHPAPR
jgi:hypothetical protein